MQDSKITRSARKWLQKAKMHSNPRAFRMNADNCKLHLEVAFIKFSEQHFGAALGVDNEAEGRAPVSRPSRSFRQQQSGPSARNADTLADVDIVDMLEVRILQSDVHIPS